MFEETSAIGARAAVGTDHKFCAAATNCTRSTKLQPVLVPCLRSGAISPSTASSWVKEEKNTPPVETKASKIVTCDARSGADPSNSVDDEAGEVEARRQEIGAGESERGTIVASVRAGDWVLPNRRGGVGGNRSNEAARRKESGWLRVEAVSVG